MNLDNFREAINDCDIESFQQMMYEMQSPTQEFNEENKTIYEFYNILLDENEI